MSTQFIKPTLFPAAMKGEALFSPCEIYRYTLRRVWDPELGRVVFCMLNPSTATAEVFDPTVRRCYGFAKDWGFGGFDVVNLFALRSTDPSALMRHPEPIGPENDKWILETVLSPAVKKVVAAWGTWGHYRSRGARVRAMLQENGVEVWCLGHTQEGFPKHPLYVKAATELQLL